MNNYTNFNGMPLDVAELYAENKRGWQSGKNQDIYKANNQNIRDAYGITQDVPLAQVEDYISALKREGTKNQLLTKISSTALPTSVTSAAEKIQNFNYNPDNDAAYKSYVDAYNRQGQSAAKQTLNNLNAANMGRNSSYSAAATAQVQAAYAKQAADMIPQLAQQAYDRLMNNYSITKDIEDTKYNRAITGYNALADDKTRQLTDEQLRLGNIGADINNQASQIELAYLEPSLRQQVLSGTLSLDEAMFKNQMMKEYGKRQWDAETRALENQAAGKVSGGSGGGGGGSSSYSKQQSMADADESISNMLYSPLDGNGNYWGWFDANTADNVYVGYMAKDKIRDDTTRKNIIDSLMYSGYTYDAALKKVDEYATNIARNILRREGKDWDDDAVQEYKDKWGMNYK